MLNYLLEKHTTLESEQIRDKF